MATTETRTGFRLPWSQDESANGASSSEPVAEAETDVANATETDVSADPTATAAEGPDMIDTSTEATADPVVSDDVTSTESADVAETTETAAAPTEPAAGSDSASTAPGRKPNKLMVDLAKAMQTAAEGARADTLEKFAADAKAHVEKIEADAATEAADLRRQADDDIAGVRDWSKTEIARIREETERRISARKTGLEGELEDHAADTERGIARVQGKVEAFEAEMAYFFEQLLAEEDPTKLAAMAQSLPEPPDFNDDSAAPTPVRVTETAEADTITEVTASETAEDPDAAFAAIEAAARAADEAEADAGPTAEVAAEADPDAPADVDPSDPRIEALGLSADAAADAEAASLEAAESSPADEDIPVIEDDALAARLAGLVPEMEAKTSAPKAETTATRVVVVGLVSVASIASFKRHLGRVAGVQSVGVSSGPDGEFVFVVNHLPEIALKDAVATLPGFGARVTGESEGGLQVSAKDPEAES